MEIVKRLAFYVVGVFVTLAIVATQTKDAIRVRSANAKND